MGEFLHGATMGRYESELRRQTAELLQEAPSLADAQALEPAEPFEVTAPPAEAVREGPHAMAPARRARRVRPQQMELSLSA